MLNRLWTKLRNAPRLKAFARETSGVAAVEFAMVAPIALAIFCAEAAVCDAMSARRKLTITNHAVADLIARQSSVSSSSLSSILNASMQIMAPYSTTNLSIVVAHVTTNGSGVTKVDWSTAFNGTALTAGATITLPTGMAQNNTSMLYTLSTYTYMPSVSYLFRSLTFTDKFYENPRVTSSISKTS